MNKNKALLAGAAMVALSMPLAQKEAKAASATIQASAVVVDAIQLAAVSALHFGSMSISAAGTVTVSTAGVRSAGTLGVNPIAGGAENNGVFTLTMPDAAADFDVTFPITLVVGSLSVDQIFLDFPGAAPQATLNSVTPSVTNVAITGASLGAPINVGGRLNAVAGPIAAGTYSAGVVLTANYN